MWGQQKRGGPAPLPMSQVTSLSQIPSLPEEITWGYPQETLLLCLSQAPRRGAAQAGAEGAAGQALPPAWKQSPVEPRGRS